MNLYVDVTEEEKFKEAEKIESSLKNVQQIVYQKYRERQKPLKIKGFWTGI